MNLFTYGSSGYFRKSSHCRGLSVSVGQIEPGLPTPLLATEGRINLNLEGVLPAGPFRAIAVLVLVFFFVGTAAAQPQAPLSSDSLNRPPVSAELAFVREGQIYLVNADGTGLIQLTDTEPGVENIDPAWSRDGQRLAFARGGGVGGPWDIFIMDADGSNVVQLTSGGYNFEPTWGPDDLTIAFSSLTNGSSSLAVVDVDAAGSQGPTILLDNPGWDAQPAWSPDGQTITFTSDSRAYDFVYDLYAMNSDGTDVRPLIEGPFFWGDGLALYFQSAWSPDGQSIAAVSCTYAWDNCYPDSTIVIANADGSGLREIALAGGYASPTWSPDGQWIAFGSAFCRSCESSIRFVSVDGGDEGLLMDDGHSPAWRPDPDIQNGPDDPDTPIKEPDEPQKPTPIKFPECGSKCDKREKLTGGDSPENGSESFSLDTDRKVYFCDPQSPWQRGSNENTNGLLRQYFPEGMELSNVHQNRLKAVARLLNERPRESLNFETPAERFKPMFCIDWFTPQPKAEQRQI